MKKETKKPTSLKHKSLREIFTPKTGTVQIGTQTFASGKPGPFVIKGQPKKTVRPS